jgi:hypothetical protein
MSGQEVKTVPQPKEQTISDLITECQDAASKMSVTNPHKLLLLNCCSALGQLCDRLWEHEHPGIPIPGSRPS